MARLSNDIPDLVDGPEPAGHPSAADELFLTPRVIDSGAFTRYSASLRQLIEQTTRESDLLARRAEAAACILDQLERFVGSHNDIFERANTLLGSIDDRQARSHELLGLLQRQTELAEAAGRELERAANDRAEAFEARIGTIINTEMDRFEETQSQLCAGAATIRRDLVERLEQVRSRGEAMLGELEQRASSLAEGLPAMLESAEAARRAIADEAKHSIQRLVEQGEQGRDGIESAGGRIQRELDAATRSLREAIAAGSAHRDTIERAAELAIGRVQTGVSEQTLELEGVIRRGERSVRDSREAITAAATEAEARAAGARDSVHSSMTEAQARLERLFEQVARAAESAEHARREHTELRSLAEALHGRESELAAHIERQIQQGIANRLEPMSATIQALMQKVEALESQQPAQAEPIGEPDSESDPPVVTTTVRRKASAKSSKKPTTRKKTTTKRTASAPTKKKTTTTRKKATQTRAKASKSA